MLRIWVAKEGDTEDDAVPIEMVNGEKTIYDFLETIVKELFPSEDVRYARSLLLMQGEKKFGNRSKVSEINEDDIVRVIRKTGSSAGPSNGQKELETERIVEMEKLDQKLIDLGNFKRKMIAQSISIDEVREAFKLDSSLNRQAVLKALDKLEDETKIIKVAMTAVNFTSVDMSARCSELLELNLPHGFVFKVKKAVVTPSASELTFKFENQEDHQQCKKSVLPYKNKNAITVGIGFSGFAFGAINSASLEYTGEFGKPFVAQSSEKENRKATMAIVCNRSVFQYAKFRCEEVSLNESALQDAKNIVEVEDKIQQEERALEFLDKYPAEILTGYFGIGGWFEYTATTRSTTERKYSELLHEATVQSEHRLKATLSKFLTLDLNKVNDEGGSKTNETKSKSETFATTFEFESDGPTVSNLTDLERELRDPKKWTVFPAIGTQNHHYERIDDLMNRYGRDNDCESLMTASKIVKNIIDNGPSHFVRPVVIPSDATMKNVIVFGRTGSGKSALGNVLIGRYDDGFEVNDAQEACTQETTAKESQERKVKYYDTMGTFDTKYYDEKVHSWNVNQHVISQIVQTWEAIGQEGLHCIIFTLNFQTRLTKAEARLAKAAAENLFERDASDRLILVMTKVDDGMVFSREKCEKWIKQQLKSKTNDFRKFYEAVGKDKSRIIFVDNKMPKYAPDTPEDRIKYEQRNIFMAERMLMAIHSLPNEGISVPVAGLLEIKEGFKIALNAEMSKEESSRDLERIALLEEEKEKIDSQINETAKKNSCFLESTRILLANGATKMISELKSTDIIADRFFNSQNILGVNYTYLGGRQLYSFGEEGPMFTPEHQFFTSYHEDTTAAVSLDALMEENPQAFNSSQIQEISESTNILQVDMKTKNTYLAGVNVNGVNTYSCDTKVYFVEVTGDGSYIVAGNDGKGYVAKHELPHFTDKPYLNLCLGSVLLTYQKSGKRFSVSPDCPMNSHVKRILRLWRFVTDLNMDLGGFELPISEDFIENESAVMRLLSSLFAETDASWLAMFLNRECARFLDEQLDSNEILTKEEKMAQIRAYVHAAKIYFDTMNLQAYL